MPINRQLHPTKTQWIKANAKRYANKKGISEADEVSAAMKAKG